MNIHLVFSKPNQRLYPHIRSPELVYLLQVDVDPVLLVVLCALLGPVVVLQGFMFQLVIIIS